MLNWICPDCGQEVMPPARECPACAQRLFAAEPAALSTEASVDSAQGVLPFALLEEEQIAVEAAEELPVATVVAQQQAPLTPEALALASYKRKLIRRIERARASITAELLTVALGHYAQELLHAQEAHAAVENLQASKPEEAPGFAALTELTFRVGNFRDVDEPWTESIAADAAEQMGAAILAFESAQKIVAESAISIVPPNEARAAGVEPGELVPAEVSAAEVAVDTQSAASGAEPISAFEAVEETAVESAARVPAEVSTTDGVRANVESEVKAVEPAPTPAAEELVAAEAGPATNEQELKTAEPDAVHAVEPDSTPAAEELVRAEAAPATVEQALKTAEPDAVQAVEAESTPAAEELVATEAGPATVEQEVKPVEPDAVQAVEAESTPAAEELVAAEAAAATVESDAKTAEPDAVHAVEPQSTPAAEELAAEAASAPVEQEVKPAEPDAVQAVELESTAAAEELVSAEAASAPVEPEVNAAEPDAVQAVEPESTAAAEELVRAEAGPAKIEQELKTAEPEVAQATGPESTTAAEVAESPVIAEAVASPEIRTTDAAPTSVDLEANATTPEATAAAEHEAAVTPEAPDSSASIPAAESTSIATLERYQRCLQIALCIHSQTLIAEIVTAEAEQQAWNTYVSAVSELVSAAQVAQADDLLRAQEELQQLQEQAAIRARREQDQIEAERQAILAVAKGFRVLPRARLLNAPAEVVIVPMVVTARIGSPRPPIDLRPWQAARLRQATPHKLFPAPAPLLINPGLEPRPAAPQIVKTRRKLPIPAWMLSVVLVLCLLLLVGSLLQQKSTASSEVQAASALAAPPVGAHSAPSSAPSVNAVTELPFTAHPYAKYVEVTGLRIVPDARNRSQLQYLVVNRSQMELSGVAVRISVSSTLPASKGQLFQVSAVVPQLGPLQSKEIRTDIQAQLDSGAVPDWKYLKTNVQVSGL